MKHCFVFAFLFMIIISTAHSVEEDTDPPPPFTTTTYHQQSGEYVPTIQGHQSGLYTNTTPTEESAMTRMSAFCFASGILVGAFYFYIWMVQKFGPIGPSINGIP